MPTSRTKLTFHPASNHDDLPCCMSRNPVTAHDQDLVRHLQRRGNLPHRRSDGDFDAMSAISGAKTRRQDLRSGSPPFGLLVLQALLGHPRSDPSGRDRVDPSSRMNLDNLVLDALHQAVRQPGFGRRIVGVSGFTEFGRGATDDDDVWRGNVFFR